MEDSTVKLRKANPEDLTDIRRLFTDTIHAVCADDYSPEQISAWAASAGNTRLWEEKVETQYFLIAEIEGDPVGFGSLALDNTIDLLYIHKDYQKKGIATMLCRKLEAEALSRGASVLFSHASITAKPFFEKMGFVSRRRQTQIRQGVEIVNYLMEKKLR